MSKTHSHSSLEQEAWDVDGGADSLLSGCSLQSAQQKFSQRDLEFARALLSATFGRTLTKSSGFLKAVGRFFFFLFSPLDFFKHS